MAASAIEVVRAFFEAPDTRADLLDPGVEFLPLTQDHVFGPAGVLRVLDDIAEHFISRVTVLPLASWFEVERLVSEEGDEFLRSSWLYLKLLVFRKACEVGNA